MRRSAQILMEETMVSLQREGLEMIANRMDKVLKYEDKHDIPYDYAMTQKICHKFQKKVHLSMHWTF